MGLDYWERSKVIIVHTNRIKFNLSLVADYAPSNATEWSKISILNRTCRTWSASAKYAKRHSVI